MNLSKDPSLFRAQRAEEEVRRLREENTSLKVSNLTLTRELQKSQETLSRTAEETAEALRLAKQLLEKAWGPQAEQ
jgi:hypothetical protein